MIKFKNYINKHSMYTFVINSLQIKKKRYSKLQTQMFYSIDNCGSTSNAYHTITLGEKKIPLNSNRSIKWQKRVIIIDTNDKF